MRRATIIASWPAPLVMNRGSRPVVRAVGSGDSHETLNNRTIAQRAGKKGITNAKKTDGKQQ